MSDGPTFPGDPGDVTSEQPLSDRGLLDAHIAGDTQAFGTLIARHKDRLWAVALRTTGDPEEAADALQDALISAFRRADQFRGDSAVTTWLHRIVVNAALTRLGAPYAWAAAGPDAFDCSGLVVWAFKQAGLTMPHSSTALASGGEPVALDQMQPGDVISLFPDASHVGIYAGNGRMIHAQFEGLAVIVESLRGAPINNVRRYR